MAEFFNLLINNDKLFCELKDFEHSRQRRQEPIFFENKARLLTPITPRLTPPDDPIANKPSILEIPFHPYYPEITLKSARHVDHLLDYA